jgi:uncharacterized MAPEG superfamily protein
MTPMLTYLFWAALLTFVQMLAAVLLTLPRASLPTLAGNREGMGEQEGMAGRAQRAHRNMLESLVLFAILVLIAHLSQRGNATTLLGAQLFVGARLVYALVYIAGIPWLRTAVWAVSVAGLALIASQLV